MTTSHAIPHSLATDTLNACVEAALGLGVLFPENVRVCHIRGALAGIDAAAFDESGALIRGYGRVAFSTFPRVPGVPEMQSPVKWQSAIINNDGQLDLDTIELLI